MPVQRIALIGLSGAGKSLVGRILARKLGWAFLDSDQEIANRQGITVAELFASAGESEFRRIESQVVADMTSQGAVVISTGGGAVLARANREQLSRCYIAQLQAPPEALYERLSRSPSSLAQRPLLQGPDPLGRIRAMGKRRAPYYAIADLSVQTEGQSPEASAEEIRQSWRVWRETNLHSEQRRRRIFLDDLVAEERTMADAALDGEGKGDRHGAEQT